MGWSYLLLGFHANMAPTANNDACVHMKLHLPIWRYQI
jgi:hypothetical protein